MKRGSNEGTMNRTGAALHPEGTRELVSVTEATPPSSPGDGRLIHAIRNEYAREGELLGHLPKAGAEKAGRGKKASLFAMLLDKMGARLAFERSGVRLYEALLAKLDAKEPIGPVANAPDRKKLERICRQEHEHFQLLCEAIERLGGDPTAMTPAANVGATAASGLPKVLLDPRSTFAQCLHAILVAELTDRDGWQLLVELAEANGQDELAARFRDALETEEEHLELVRQWILEATLAGEPAAVVA